MPTSDFSDQVDEKHKHGHCLRHDHWYHETRRIFKWVGPVYTLTLYMYTCTNIHTQTQARGTSVDVCLPDIWLVGHCGKAALSLV